MRTRWTLAAGALCITLGLVVAVTQREGVGLVPPPPPTGHTTPRAGQPVRAEVESLTSLYATDRGHMDAAARSALKAERARAHDALVRSVAEGGAAVVGPTLEAIRQGAAREQLVLVEGLGRNPSPEAVAALEVVYGEAGTFRLRESVLTALGGSDAPGHTALLEEVLTSQDDTLAQVAAMALSGELEAVDALRAAVDAEAPMAVRLEALSSLGEVGTPEARAEVQAVADDPTKEPRVRQYASHVLARGG